MQRVTGYVVMGAVVLVTGLHIQLYHDPNVPSVHCAVALDFFYSSVCGKETQGL